MREACGWFLSRIFVGPPSVSTQFRLAFSGLLSDPGFRSTLSAVITISSFLLI